MRFRTREEAGRISRPKVTVLIATYNRAELLGETLDSLADSQTSDDLTWEVIVVDNNSTDNTRAIVGQRQASYPVPLQYLFETRQGRSCALNTGMSATNAPLLLFTDDDVRVDRGWLSAGASVLEHGADYVGGPVVPIWEAPPPRWLDLTRSDLWGTIAILDYGQERFVFEDRHRVPLGANMGCRRALIERVGGFRSDLGRSNGPRVLGQEVPELLTRARAAGLHGVYVPEMTVDHHIPAGRLTKRYFRRWWVGKGYSKAIFESVQPLTELGLDLRAVPHVCGIPRFMIGDAIRDVIAYVRGLFKRDIADRFRHEMRLAYLVGYLRARAFRRRIPYPTVTAPVGMSPSDRSSSAPA